MKTSRRKGEASLVRTAGTLCLFILSLALAGCQTEAGPLRLKGYAGSPDGGENMFSSSRLASPKEKYQEISPEERDNESQSEFKTEEKSWSTFQIL